MKLSEEELNILSTALSGDYFVSVSWIQRRFGCGYPRACAKLDRLLKAGAIDKFSNVKYAVIVSEEDLENK